MGDASSFKIFRSHGFHWLLATVSANPWVVHFLVSAVIFSNFVFFGHIFFANTDLTNHNYPNMLMAREAFLQNDFGQWNPYTFLGAPSAVAGGTPLLSIENWPLFLAPKQFFFQLVTFFAFIKFFLIGSIAYLFFCIELGSKRWALFSSLVYQLSGWVMWATVSYVTLGIILYFTIFLTLVWTMERRSFIANYVLMAFFLTLLLMTGNAVHASYCTMAAGLLSVYRIACKQTRVIEILKNVVCTGGAAVTAILIFASRMLPINEMVSGGTRDISVTPSSRSFDIFSLRFFEPEIFGINFNTSIAILDGLVPATHQTQIHGDFPDYFGVLPLLLVVISVFWPKSVAGWFWSVWVGLSALFILRIQPFDLMAHSILRHFHHDLAIHNFLPIGFSALAGWSGIRLERSLRSGNLPATLNQTIIFLSAFVFVALLAVIFRTSGALEVATASSRLIVVVVLLALSTLALAFSWIWIRNKKFPARETSVVCLLVGFLVLFLIWPASATYTSHIKLIGAQLILLSLLLLAIDATSKVPSCGNNSLPRMLTSLLFLVAVGSILFPWTNEPRASSMDGESTAIAYLGLLRFVVVVFVFLLLINRLPLNLRKGNMFSILCLVLLLVEQVPAAKKHSHMNANPFIDASTLFPVKIVRDENGNVLDLDLKNFRVNFPSSMINADWYASVFGRGNEVCSSINAASGIRSYAGYNNTVPVRNDVFAKFFGTKIDEKCWYASSTNSRFLTLAGVRYSYDSDRDVVVDREVAMSRFMFFTEFDSMLDEREMLVLLGLNVFDPMKKLLVGGRSRLSSIDTNENGRVLSYAQASVAHLIVDTDTENAGFIFFNDTYNRGWMALVNGERREILVADYNFMALEIPAGSNRIEFIYAPDSVTYGFKFAQFGAGLITMAVFAWMFTWVRTRPFMFVPTMPKAPILLVVTASILVLVQSLVRSTMREETQSSFAKKISIAWRDESGAQQQSTMPKGALFLEAKVGSEPVIDLDFAKCIFISNYHLSVGPFGVDSTDRMPASWDLLLQGGDGGWKYISSEVQSNFKNGAMYKFSVPPQSKCSTNMRIQVKSINNSNILRISDVEVFGKQ